jgi:Zn-dependent peptidase ImmA (M78 family)
MRDDRQYQPDFAEGENVAPRRALARGVAVKMIAEFQLKGPPVDIALLIRERGLKLVCSEADGALSGQLFPDQREVFVNTHNRHLHRQRFTMAHELGHWELRHYLEDELQADSMGFEGAFDGLGQSEGRSPIEIEANTFAAEILIPGAWIKRERRPLAPGRADQLGNVYQVSREAMFYQLMHLKMF